MTDAEKESRLTMFQAAMEEMRKGKIRLNPDLWAVVKSWILTKVLEHQNCLEGLERRAKTRKFPGIEASIAYRKAAITALRECADNVANSVRRSDFWEVAGDVAVTEGLIDESAESVGLSVEPTTSP